VSQFDAGAIVGHLQLNTSEFSESMRESSSLAGIFAEEIGRVLAEATGSPLLGELANGISEITASLAEGNGAEAFAASIHLVGAAVGGFIEMIKSQAEEMHTLGIQAERAGVSVGWLSTYGKASEEFGLGVESLTMSMEILQRNSADAAGGAKEQTESFSRLGISMDWVKQHLDDSQAMFQMVIEKLHELGAANGNAEVASQLFGRGWAALRPIIDDGGAAINELTQELNQFGGSVTSQNVKVSDSFGELTAVWKAFEAGIEREVSVPILEWIEKHKPTILADLGEFKTWLDTALPTALNSLQKDMDSFSTDHFRQEIRDALKDVADLAGDIKTIQWAWDSDPVNWAIKQPFEAVWGDNSPTADATRAAAGYIAGQENDEPYSDDPAALHERQRDHPIHYNDSRPPTTQPSAPTTQPSSGDTTITVHLHSIQDPIDAATKAVRQAMSKAARQRESDRRHRNAEHDVQ
jgi:hypothetical protein